MFPTTRISLERLPGEAISCPEQKDPTIIERHKEDPVTPYRFIKYVSSGRSDKQSWKVGRFGASDLEGHWQELRSPTLEGLSGPQLCAPAMAYDYDGETPHFTMYIQTACFEPGGVIMEAHSSDGQHFRGVPKPLVTKNSVAGSERKLIGVYDPSYSQVQVNSTSHDCLTFTGITRMEPSAPHRAEGDIYVMRRERNRPGAEWSVPHVVLQMSKISFHNQPGSGDHEYEWCPEGTQIIGLGQEHFLMVGVCFMPKPAGCDGERQRVFLAASRSVDGPFIPMSMPFEPQFAKGENGHPDTVVDHQTQMLHVILQEREGDRKPWMLRQGKIAIARLKALMDGCLNDDPAPLAAPA